MPILFAISILALVALLWATFSIASHIRRTRHASNASDAILPPEHDFAASRVHAASSSEVTLQTFAEGTAELEVSHVHEVAVPFIEPTTATQQQPSFHPEQAPAPVLQQALPVKFPPTAAGPHRIDWAYYKEEMGDLTDPVPAHPRLRSRAR